MRTIKQQITGGAVNTSLKKPTIEAYQEDPDTLEQIKNLIGHYRLFSQSASQEPGKTEAIQYFDQLSKKSRSLLDDLGLVINQKMPAGALAACPDLFQLMIRLNEDLPRLVANATHLKQVVNSAPEKTGRRPKFYKEKLLSDVSAILEAKGLGKIAAAGRAIELLQLNLHSDFPTLHAPKNGDDLARRTYDRIRKYRKENP